MHLQIPRFLRPLFGKNLLWTMPTNRKEVFLTFDDGPVPEVTPQLLDLLDKHGVKATFFCVGDNVQKYPELFEEVKRRGHLVGNHTFNHLKGWKTDTDLYVENVRKADKIIQSYLFRPPHGQISRSQNRALKADFQIVMWDIISYDYDKNLSPARVLQNVTKHTRSGSIIVFHDSIKAQKNMFDALPKALEFWKNEGYELSLLPKQDTESTSIDQ
ncbi:MAG: polysaccharide deacetylase family protein [Prevotellaceae bacterium]|jgi:peptidoglycan/xylan/chitin deacetylase (PgdA/CDA1 family)|nr:polysaccharide deacetylase family protein [Prevotellaceae bacterium]